LRQARTWLDVSIVGIQFPVAIGLGYFFGRWLDGMFGTKPWCTAVFSLFGIIAGFINLFRITAQAGRDEAAEAKRKELMGESGPTDSRDAGGGGDRP